MPVQKTVTAYTFEELSEEAKDKARDWFRGCLDSEDLSYQTVEDASQVGIKITGWDIGRAQEIDLEFEDSAFLSAKRIVEEHGAMCDTYEVARSILQLQEGTQAAYDAGDIDEETANERHEAEVEAFTKEIGECYLKMLREEYEHRMSDEGIDEDMEANDYLFTEDGSRTTVL